jgi:hypothetical protein
VQWLGRRSRRKPSPDFGWCRRWRRLRTSLPSLEASLRSLHFSPTPTVLVSPGENPSSGFRSGRWRRLRRFPLEGIVLESRRWLFGGAPLLSWLVNVGAAAPNGGCAPRRRPRDPWRVAASWGAAASWLGLGGNFVSLVRRGCWLGQRVSAEAVGLQVGAAAPDVGVAAVVCGRFCRAAWAADGRVARRRSSIASGGTSGWWSRKVVLVVCAGRAERLDVGAAAPKVWQCCGHRSCVVWARRLLWRQFS